MSTTFSWNIVDLERETNDDYVYVIHYDVNAKNGTYKARCYGSINIKRPEGELIPYNDLTHELVISWLQQALGVEKVSQIEDNLQTAIEQQITPTQLSGLPWAN